ncbi:MAG: DNA alkylation repair protein [Hymenobacteraceae bacterium]|nr:DNA alkylation repair protein [Hymenobacteraceae bacterium]MDX5397301.1 DNA alkylation repair protein [Hymenobacteraceae bacterium]MDX5513379.1 DNA alkylation repair protein [Hymenobacteraceae bacterium]
MQTERFLLKNIYSSEFINGFADVLAQTLPQFNKPDFVAQVFDEEWEQRELKQRMKHLSQVLHHFLPQHFPKAAQVIVALIEKLKTAGFTKHGLEFMFLPDYIEKFGLEFFEESVQAMEQLTKFTSCEFAVRPFILKYEAKMLQQMTQWSGHENEHVRRLASEGSRPRLPWAVALPALKRDPKPVLPLLENLKQDPSEYVRRSVANHLNDISKDNPDVLLALAQQWKNISPETDRILKHACRTLLKQGHPQALQLFGLNNCDQIELKMFEVLTPQVQIGDYLQFALHFQNTHLQPQKIRLEYGIDYLKANGSLSRKVFKISEKEYAPQEQVQISRRQSFKPITTRKFYPGPHRVALLMNGVEQQVAEFELLE